MAQITDAEHVRLIINDVLLRHHELYQRSMVESELRRDLETFERTMCLVFQSCRSGFVGIGPDEAERLVMEVTFRMARGYDIARHKTDLLGDFPDITAWKGTGLT